MRGHAEKKTSVLFLLFDDFPEIVAPCGAGVAALLGYHAQFRAVKQLDVYLRTSRTI